MKILVVDDNQLGRQMLAHALRSYGELRLASSGEEAIESFKQAWAEEAPFDVIFMDIMMPGVDGQEALRQLRTWEAEHQAQPQVKVVMSTVLADKENIQTSFKAGAEYYLVKPFELKRLAEVMANLGFPKPA
ncbi:MAG: hypothetical protein A2600_05985 [Candidatus Lambdaproteobacteria bacterium RIFOXYD1_FULL_56_27]|uniref:Response regulatory domain-containing protein n=1 Tax=Candidatus Lambdaproteobacteria bacterium RIFOXYD2_FULL_56_26 TaxID=1817773 RepID=A0A1F6GM89_9PROT|nr:MAG: hypothetical protein A2557_10110 [Candidatus Lambdaproteobacteria bacterium RIFOXYD2_FULL_56_26]OGH01758.1 MAG: hypothetical protein A2426_14020 [Candidatus Lambdaproteobacteria bacterium RIFOXYC1_FULL_56_13]OGH07631.1 MAG: hypothetical protein A2600_05985 [Candidatus Lambdaproteobacteria bacterium RIFOXYD1_FULL_56_27]